MIRNIKLVLITVIIFAVILSCTTETVIVKPSAAKAPAAEIHFNSGEYDPELFYFSDIYDLEEPVKYISYRGSYSADSSETGSSGITGISMISETKLVSSDRKGNILFYRKKGDIWLEESSLSLKTDETESFSAFSADASFLCLYSDITDSIYMFNNSESPSFVLKLFTEDTSFSRSITDMDMEAGYIYLIDTENRISIIDYREKRFETEFILDSRLPLRSFSIINEKDSSSLAALSPGSDKVFIYPLSEQYMMVKEKGYIKKAGLTSFNYGSHVLVSDEGDILYALKSSIIDLSRYTRGEVTVTGKLIPEYPVDGGPEFLSVSDVK